jgi:ParB-like chromosome segregation protein Spo0J
MKDPKAIRKAIMTAKNIATMVDPHFARVPLPEIGESNPEEMMPQQFSAGGPAYGDNSKIKVVGEHESEPRLVPISPKNTNYRHVMEYVPIKWLLQHRGNDYRHSEEKMAQLRNEIEAEGLREPVLISVGKNRRTAVTGEGNHRVLAAHQLGYTHIPARAAVGDAYHERFPEGQHDEDIIPQANKYFPSEAKPSRVMRSLGYEGQPELPERWWDEGYAAGGYAGGGTPDEAPDYASPDDLGLYSHAAATAASLPQAKASPDEFRNMLTNRGVKPAEFQWSGYDDAFADQPQVTREQVAAHFHENKPPIGQKVFQEGPLKGEAAAIEKEYDRRWNEHRRQMHAAQAEGRVFDPDSEQYIQIGRDRDMAREALKDKYQKPYHESYMLPGGENYREVALKQDGDVKFPGRSVHLGGEPNVLTHLLMKDRTDTEGKKVLHLDELQSDWAQKGRKEGFDEDSADKHKSAQKKYNDFLDRLVNSEIQRRTENYKNEHPDDSYIGDFTPEDFAQTIRDIVTARPSTYARNAGLADEFNTVRDAYHAALDADQLRTGVKKAPYVTNTNDWVDLGLKRALLEAAKGGHDKLALTPGDVAADRYDLSKHVSKIEYIKKPDGDNGYLLAHGHHQANLISKFVDDKDLPGIIGKDVAEKLLSTAPTQKEGEDLHRHTLEGLDLRVGGEGMKKFYDEMVPKRLMRLAKMHDPDAKFSVSTVRHPMEYDEDKQPDDDQTDLLALEITPRMRESILKKGFPAYAQGGEVEGYAGGGMPVGAQPNPMAGSFTAENTPSVTVSPRPGKMGGYPVRAGTMEEHEPWTYTTPQGEDQPTPPPVQHPVFNEPRMDRIHKATHKIFKSKGFNDLTEELTGLRNFNIKPIIGTWKGEIEPSFHISHPDMTPEAAEKLSHLLGFGFMQDAAVKGLHNPNPENEGIPSVYMGRDKKLSKTDLDRIHAASRDEGLDFSQTSDGRGVKFMHFGDEGDEFDKFAESAKRVQEKAGLPHIHHVNTSGDLNYAQNYLRGIFGPHEGEAGESGDFGSPSRPSDLFGRVVTHLVAPYAKAVASEGYRLSPERLKDTYGLTDDEHEQVRKALMPGSGDRTVIPLMEGKENLDIRPTGDRGKATVGDALFALQNRAAAKGQIEPGDYSPEAMKKIAGDIAKEVDYHVNTADKSAIGWYDAALKKAMDSYEGVFPELKTDADKRTLFHAILGITSQGNDVHSNSVHTARLYNYLRDGSMTMPEGVQKLSGTFGDKTNAIEQNLLKFHQLVDTNGYDKMRDLFGQKKSVSEWNKILKQTPELFGPNGKPLSMQGGATQKVTGWTMFGPKIGSFINNLSGDYSTLTADLWFSRTWNRLLGHNFLHTPIGEAKQYQDFRDAMIAEHAHNSPDQALDGVAPGKTSNGKVAMANGAPKPWEHGNDVGHMSRDEMDSLVNDPDKMLEMAQTLNDKYRKGGYKQKTDLRRRAKNWIENRENPVAAPRTDSERDFQQNTVERAQRILKSKYGKDITVADIQAALWFLEKDLFGKMGVASEKAAPADYADAAHNTINLINSGTLYNVKSRPGQATPITKAYGGGVRKAMAVAAMSQGNQVRSAMMIAKGIKKK